MRALILALLVSPAFATDKPNPKPPVIKPEPVVTDTWDGKDKQDHFVGSVLLGVGARTFLTAQPVTAGGLCMVPSLIKEAYDARKGHAGAWSWKDIAANGLGCVFGVAGTDAYLTKDGNRYTLGFNWRF